MKRKGLSIPSILTILLTIAVLAGCVLVYAAFHSDADIPMATMKMAGLLSDSLRGDAPPETNPVNKTTITLPPQPAATTPPTLPPAQPTAAPQLRITLAGMAAFESNVADSVYDKNSMICDYSRVLPSLLGRDESHLRLVVAPQAFNASGRAYSDQAAHPSAALALHNAGFDVAVVNSDALLRQGAQTVTDTVNALYQNGLSVCGVNAGNARQMLVLEENGMKIALIGYAEKISTSAGNTLQSTAGNGMLTADTMEELEGLIQQARNQGCHFVMVYLQWQDTAAQRVTDAMRSTALEVTAAGADMIIGTGIQRLLPAAWLSTSDENGIERRALTLYSIGSLLTESREGYNLSGALVHLTLTAKGKGAEIQALSYEPTYIWRQYMDGAEQYRVVINAQAPEEMNESQRDVMLRCKNRTDESLLNTLRLTIEE